jgi:hypothetical protein
MLSCVLLDLPEAIPRLVFVEWLHLKQIVRLDSAFCSHQLREQYLTLAYGECTGFTLSIINQHRKMDDMLRWTTSRGVRLNGILLSGGVPCGSDLLSPFLTVSGSAIKWVTFQGFNNNAINQTNVLEVAKSCPNVQKLKVYGDGPWAISLPVLAKAFQSLTVMTLEAVKLPKQCLAAALVHCRYLEKLKIRAGSAVPTEVAIPSLKSIILWCSGLTDEILSAIGQHCAGLETLWVFGSSTEVGYAVSEVGVRAVLEGCPLLRETDVEYAAGINEDLRIELARRP